MTAGAGVPPELLRRVLEALRDDAFLRDGPATFEARSNAAGRLAHACTAALAAASGPDAGTGEGSEPCPDCGYDVLVTDPNLREPVAARVHAPDCPRSVYTVEYGVESPPKVRRVRPHRSGCGHLDCAPASASDAGTGERVKFHPDCTAARCGDPDLAAVCRPGLPCYSAPRTRTAPVSGAAPEEPIWDAKTPDPEAENDPSLSDEEWAKVEAEMDAERAAAPEERDGELDMVISDIERLAGPGRTLQWRDDTGAMAIGEKLRSLVAQRERAAREAGRAEMGEVVGTAQVIPHWEDGDEYCPDIQILSGWLPTGDTKPYTVDLVRRRGKLEEG